MKIFEQIKIRPRPTIDSIELYSKKLFERKIEIIFQHSPVDMLRLHRRMEQIFHCIVALGTHHTSGRPRRTVSLRHAYRYLHAAVERNELKSLRCSSADLRKPHVRHPIK